MSRTPPVFYWTIVLAALAAGTGWSGAASAQSPKSPETRIEVQRAQRELTAAERVLRDVRAARAKTETDIAERLSRLDERRRSALALPDEAGRRAVLGAIAAEQESVRAEQAKTRAAEAAAERNAETAALALARARSSPPPAATPAPAPAVSLEDLIHARMDVESAEAALARAKTAREDIERKTGDEIHDLTRRLANAAELRKRAGDGPLAAEAAGLEARLKALIQDATAKMSGAETREAEAQAALEAARAREARVRAEIEARLPAR